MWTRREFVTTALSLSSIAASRQDSGSGLDSRAHELVSLSCRTMASRLRSGELGASELVDAHLSRIEAVNPRLNAVVALAAERARQEAAQLDAAAQAGTIQGPLHGIPFTVKDSFDTEGIVSTAGTLGRKDHVPRRDATLVAKLREAGAVLLGKTNTPELTFAWETDNLVYGRTNNPFDRARTPGGSSGGATAIVSALGSAFEIGSDTGGSIRMPAHFCGVCGLRPTSSRLSRAGHIVDYEYGVTMSFTSVGPIARNIGDLIWIYELLRGPDRFDPNTLSAPDDARNEVRPIEGLRIAYHDATPYESSDEDTRRTLDVGIETLRKLGCVVTKARPQILAKANEIFVGLLLADGGANIRRLLERENTAKVHPWLQESLDGIPEEISASGLQTLVRARQNFQIEMLRFMDAFDAIVSPVNTFPAPPHRGTMLRDMMSSNFTLAYNLCDWPAVVFPAGRTDSGLPIGLQVASPPFQEARALAIASELERRIGGFREPPL